MSTSSAREYVALDLETTGLRAETDRIVEIGAVRFDENGRILDRFQSLVNPDRPMPPSAQAIHSLGDVDLAAAPIAAQILPAFLRFLDAPSTILLAHNAWFDAGFLGQELKRAEIADSDLAVVDTLALARRRLPLLPNHRLDTIAQALGLELSAHHRAMADSIGVMGLWLALGGPRENAEDLVAYTLRSPQLSSNPPVGWDAMCQAITLGSSLRMEYAGGTRGLLPRVITPRKFVQRGGVSYLVALCHLDEFEKQFRLDRVRWYEVVS